VDIAHRDPVGDCDCIAVAGPAVFRPSGDVPSATKSASPAGRLFRVALSLHARTLRRRAGWAIRRITDRPTRRAVRTRRSRPDVVKCGSREPRPGRGHGGLASRCPGTGVDAAANRGFTRHSSRQSIEGPNAGGVRDSAGADRGDRLIALRFFWARSSAGCSRIPGPTSTTRPAEALPCGPTAQTNLAHGSSATAPSRQRSSCACSCSMAGTRNGQRGR
jgi:hypothetical protein